jgi:hypothetical protein
LALYLVEMPRVLKSSVASGSYVLSTTIEHFLCRYVLVDVASSHLRLLLKILSPHNFGGSRFTAPHFEKQEGKTPTIMMSLLSFLRFRFSTGSRKRKSLSCETRAWKGRKMSCSLLVEILSVRSVDADDNRIDSVEVVFLAG